MPPAPPRQLALALLLSCLCAFALSRADILPPGPGTDYAEVGEGSDLDIQLQMATVAASYAGRMPVWDPYPDFGQPLLANPEAFVGHPGFLLGGDDPHRGVRWMMRGQLLMLFLGSCWLASLLGLPFWTGLAAALPLLVSPEWHDRLGVGHFMILGLAAVPAAVAAWWASLEIAESGGRPAMLRAVRFAVPGGAAIALASLGGGHYATVFTLFLLGVASWGYLAGPRFLGALTLFLAARLFLPSDLPIPDSAAVLGVGALLLLGAWRGRERLGAALAPLFGLCVGLLAVAGWRLVPGYLLVRMTFRDRSFSGFAIDPVPLGRFLSPGRRGLEGLLWVDSPLWWVGILGGVGLLALARRPALPLAVLCLALLGWGAGGSLEPYGIASLVPGMSAINYPVRLQWFLLVLPAFGWLLGARWLAERLPSALAHPLRPLPALLALALALCAAPHAAFRPYPEAQRVASAGDGTVGGVLSGGADQTLSRTSAQGLIRPGFGTGIGFLPLHTPAHEGPALAVAEAERTPGQGAPSPLSLPVQVQARLDTWQVTAPPGTQVRLAQRDVQGWRCEGGTVLSYPEDDSLDVREPERGHNWLRLRLGPTGRATCRYHTAGMLPGLLLQGLAVLALLLLWARDREPSAR